MNITLSAKKTTYLILVLLFGWSFSCSDHTLKSPTINKNKSKEETKVDSINAEVAQIGDQQSIPKLEEAMALAETIQYFPGIAKTNEQLALKWYYLNEAGKALLYIKRAETLYRKLGDILGEAYSKNLHGKINLELKEFEEAMQLQLQALSLFQKIGDKKAEANVYLDIANINHFFDQKDIVQMFDFEYKALKLLNGEECEELAKAYNNLASDHLYINQSDSARYYLNKAVKLAEKLDFFEVLSSAKGNLAEITEDTTSKIALISEALKYDQQIGALYGMGYNFISLGLIHLELGNFEKALYYAQEAINLGDAGGNYINIPDAYDLIAECYQSQEEYKNAFDALVNAYDMRDSLYIKEDRKNIENLKLKYESDLKDQQIKTLEKTTHLQKVYSFIAIAVLLTALLILYLWRNRSNWKKVAIKKELEAIESQKREQALELENLQKQRKMDLMEKEKIRQDLEKKERELSSMAHYLARKNDLLNNLNKQVKILISKNRQGQSSAPLTEMQKVIKREMELDYGWEDFKIHFESVHPKFYTKLNKEYPFLNQNDLRLCAYIRLNLSTNEIARLQNISTESTIKARYRLKKKMGLNKEDNLNSYIREI